MDYQRMFSELMIGARFTFDHDADSGPVWTKTGRREYSRILTKRVGSTTAPVTPTAAVPDEEGDAVVMLRNLAGLVEKLRRLERIKRDGNDVITASDLDGLLAEFTNPTPDQVLERERVEEIRNAVRAARLPTEVGERLIREGVELDEARRILFATLAAKGEQ